MLFYRILNITNAPNEFDKFIAKAKILGKPGSSANELADPSCKDIGIFIRGDWENYLVYQDSIYQCWHGRSEIAYKPIGEDKVYLEELTLRKIDQPYLIGSINRKIERAFAVV